MDGEKKTSDSAASKRCIQSTSPFYLQPSDNPGVMISSCILNGDNYDLWVKAMRNALRAKNKLGFVYGTVTEPKPSEPEADVWETCNSMLVSWIFNSIDPILQPSVAYMDTAKELWDDLRERFSIGNGPRIHQLKADIAATKQQDQSVVAYYTRLKGMWDELTNYSRVPVCTCGKCTCNVVADLIREREDEKTHQFLMGLDDSVFGTVRSNILSMEVLPSLNKVYSIVIQEERHRSVARAREERGDAVGFAIHISKPKDAIHKLGVNEQHVCSHCGKTDHEMAQCFEIINYPERWSRGGRGRGGRNQGRGGRGRGRVIANVVQGPTNTSTSGDGSKQQTTSLVPGLTESQVKQIMVILSKSNASGPAGSSEKLHGPQYEDVDWCG